MSDQRPVVLAEISETSVALVYGDRPQLIIGVSADGQHLRVFAPGFDDIEWINAEDLTVPIQIKGRRATAPAPTRPQVSDTVREIVEQVRIETAPLRTITVPPARPPSVRAARRLVEGNGSRGLTNAQRDDILQAVLDSWVDHPRQDAKFTSAESHRIALDVFGEDTHHTVMRVAGVRAALTRGAYDLGLQDLVAQRRDERIRESMQTSAGV